MSRRYSWLAAVASFYAFLTSSQAAPLLDKTSDDVGGKMEIECREPEDLKTLVQAWWNEEPVYDEEDDDKSEINGPERGDSKQMEYAFSDAANNKSSSASSDRTYLSLIHGRSKTTSQNNRQTEQNICDRPPNKEVHSSVMERSLCPWQWKINFDESREPKFISEAKCMCRRSRGTSGSYCMPIRRRFTVLKRVSCNPITKRYEYVKSTEIITVGCHSVLPRSQRALPLSTFYRSPHSIEV